MTKLSADVSGYITAVNRTTAARDLSYSDRQLNAWHERQAALAEWRKKDSPANRERLELARNAMDMLLRDDSNDCE